MSDKFVIEVENLPREQQSQFVLDIAEELRKWGYYGRIFYHTDEHWFRFGVKPVDIHIPSLEKKP